MKRDIKSTRKRNPEKKPNRKKRTSGLFGGESVAGISEVSQSYATLNRMKKKNVFPDYTLYVYIRIGKAI